MPRRILRCVACLVVALIPGLLVGLPADAQTAAAPVTIWSFLGVPNPLAMNAAAQQSANPAIQAAAKAKAAKHEIPKKKKAIRYLAGIGCTPEHPEVMPALMAAMDDPDEQVRYEAVKAVLETAEICQSREQKKEIRRAKGVCGTCADLKASCEKKVCDAVERLCGKAPPKEHKHHLREAMQSMFGGECEDPAKEDCPCAERRGSCCGPEMRDKLMKLAYARDEMGCFLEPSRRVRDLAEQAFNVCNACACGCEDAGDAAMDGIVRETPPDASVRETRPSDGATPTWAEPCFDDRLLEPTHLPEPETVPTPVPLPEAEMIPAPPAAASDSVEASVLVRADLPPSPAAVHVNPLRLGAVTPPTDGRTSNIRLATNPGDIAVPSPPPAVISPEPEAARGRSRIDRALARRRRFSDPTEEEAPDPSVPASPAPTPAPLEQPHRP